MKRKIVSYRTDEILTQEAAAKGLKKRFPDNKWTRAKYQRIESGKHKIYLDDIKDICEFYDIKNPFDVLWYF